MTAMMYSLGFVEKSVSPCPIKGMVYFRWLIRGPQKHLNITGLSAARVASAVENRLRQTIDRMNKTEDGPIARWEVF